MKHLNMSIFNIWRNSNFKIIAVLVCISVFLVIKWLPAGHIIAGGDVGIPAYNPLKQLNEVSSSWWESHATGITSPITYTAIPLYLFLSGLDKIGLGPDITQKILFFIILLGSSVSIYFLSLIFSFEKKTALIASLSYILNLTSLSVWQRGVHNSMLMLLLAPLSLLILVWGITNKRYSSIILINIVSFFLSYVFGALGYLFSLWLLWIIYILIMLLGSWHDKPVRKFILTYFFILIIFWIGTNLWWIIHFLSSSGYVFDQFSATELKERGSDVLVALKTYHEPDVILRGINKYSHYITKNWQGIYLNPFFILISWFPTVIVFSTTLVRSNYKSVSWRFLFLLAIIVLIISKGVNPPFGVLNKIPYDLFTFLAPLRNPYEKVGILLTIPFSLLFALGVYQINSYLKVRKLGYLRIFTVLTVVICLTVLVWPLWLGDLWSSGGKKYIHSIPSYYGEASIWMAEKTRVDDTRILHLPLAWWESVDYNWGYTGIEPSQYFFEGSSIGYHIGINSVDARIRDILLNVHSQDSQNLQKAFSSLNIGWVIVHNETLFRDRILEPPERINKWLATNPYFLEHDRDIGPLSIWRVKDEYRAGHFYTAGKLISLKNMPTPIPQKIWTYVNNINDSFITEKQDKQDVVLGRFIDSNVIFPKPDASKNVEIILNEDSGENLVNKTFNLSNVDVTSPYQISFEVLKGGELPLFLTIAHDNDPMDSESKIQPAIVQELKLPGNLQWQKVIFNYSPPMNATSAILSFSQAQNGSSVRNLKIEKILFQDPILEEKDPQKLGTVNIEWKKVKPTLYELSLSQQIPPYIIVFSETFHPLWQITDASGKKIDAPHFIINGFANGWLIEKTLPEKIKIEFSLQKVFGRGVIFSMSVFILLVILVLYVDYRERLK